MKEKKQAFTLALQEKRTHENGIEFELYNFIYLKENQRVKGDSNRKYSRLKIQFFPF